MLTATDLSFAYGRHAVLRHVSLDIQAGDMVGVLGPNGCGKTTLLRLLSGALRPNDGAVALDGRPLHGVDRRTLARRIAVVAQHTHTTFDYSVQEIALMGRYPHLGPFQVEGPDDLAAVRTALEATGTDHLAARPFSTLSGGEQQRVAIASALAQLDPGRAPSTDSRLLLLDEPTASLDLRYQIEVAGLIARLHADARAAGSPIAVVTSTHDLRFAASVCTTVVLLRAGAVVAAGRPIDVLTAAAVAEVYGLPQDVAARVMPALEALS